jgi:hypothetical protein
MSIDIETVTEHTICFALGKVIFCKETGFAKFEVTRKTETPSLVRECIRVFEMVATMMENNKGE